jgi:hypothetical protein
MGRKIVAAGQVYAGELYVYGLTAAGLEVPFGHAQEWSLQDSMATVTADGNDSLSPLSVAAVGRTVKLNVKHLQINPEQLGVLRGVTPATVAGQANPVAGPTLGAATGSDGTWGTTGYVGVAYTLVDAYGFESAIGPVATVNIDGAAKHTAITTVSPPSGYTVNWYVTKALYGSALLAAAGQLYWHSTNSGAGFDLLGFPTSTRLAPTVSQVLSSRTVVSGYGDDVPSTFTIRTWSPSDASGMRTAFYGCFCPDISINAPLKDFWNEAVSFDVLGNGATPPKLWDIVLPASV